MQDIPPRPIPSGYDPTRNPLPPDAIRAPPGERQIAYPPEYPRAKIHATGTVHLGVRPRSVPTTTSTTVQGQEGRRPGYGELASEVPDRELPPDTRVSTTRPMSTRAADSVSVAVTRGDRKAATSIPTPTPLPATSIPTSISTSNDRQARPKMTLEQAVNEYDRTHPPSSAAATPSSSQHTRTDPPVGEAIKDDVRSHDGVYTYDYSTQPQQVGSHKGGGGGEGSGGKAHDEPNGLGPGRGYPEAPMRDDAYGVPFGKRLKAMIQLRKDAEDAGLVPVSSSSYSSADVFGSGSWNDGIPRSGLVRRPATGGGGGGDGASHRNGAMQVQGSPRKNKGKAAERPASSADNGYPKNEADVRSPSTPRPLAPQRNHPRQQPSPPRSERSTTTSASLSTATTTATTQAKIRRKPVPQYIEHSSSSSIRTRTDSPLSVVRKQKSEPGMGGGDGGDFAARLERRERRKREKERERERRAGEDESRVVVVAGRKKHGRSRSEQPQTSSDTRSQRGIPGTDTKVVDDQYGMPLKGPFTRSPLQPSQGGHTAEISLASSQITMHGGLIVPPMPEGEEYDAETEAERQAAWEEYYRLQGVVGMYDDRGSGDGQETGYPQVEEWVDTQT